MDASEIYPRRNSAKEVLTPQRREEFIFTIADGTAKLSGKDNEFREPIPRLEQTVGSEDFSGELQGEPEGPQNQHNQKMKVTRGETSGLFKVTSSIVITMCRKKKHSLFHCNTLM